MRQVRQEGTSAELAVRTALTSIGARYRLNVRSLPGSPDIANKGLAKAVLVHGCFWHFHEGCPRAKVPTANAARWKHKLQENRKRDLKQLRELESSGLEVLVVWECETFDTALLTARLHRFWFGTTATEKPIGVRDTYALTPKRQIVRTTHSRQYGRLQSSLKANPAAPFRDLMADFERAWLRSPTWPRRKPGRESLRIADLFSGCGAMTLGVSEAARALNLAPVTSLAIDNDSLALQAYLANFPSAVTVSDPIEHILDGEVGQQPTSSEETLRTKIGTLDIIVGGPPCQGHSDLNNHTRRADPRNSLLLKMVRAAELWKPDALLIENVQGICHDSEGVVATAEKLLRRLDYVVDKDLVEMSSLGLPQRRRRFVMIASRSREVDICALTRPFKAEPRTVRWAVEDLQGRTKPSGLDSASTPTPVNSSRIDYLFDNDLYDLPDSQRPRCHREKPHGYRSVYGRLRWDAPSQTITTGFGCIGQGRYIHPAERRTLTPHEAARLQFIPDFFDFSTHGRSALAKMIANAVPPKLTYVLTLGLLG